MINKSISRSDFFELIPKNSTILEIGPYAKPAYRRPQYDVYYADMYSIEQIKQNLSKFGCSSEHNPPDTIDVIMNINKRPVFETDIRVDYIFSSHNIEHIPDIITHFQEVAKLAASKETKYHLAIPDKRYCFDHWQTLTHFPKMIQAYRNQVTSNTYQTVLENLAFITHNDHELHWQDQHGHDPFSYPVSDLYISYIKKCMSDADMTDTEYVDSHNWKFTPSSFLYNMDILTKLELIPWRVSKIYDTHHNSNEFFAVLELI